MWFIIRENWTVTTESRVARARLRFFISFFFVSFALHFPDDNGTDEQDDDDVTKNEPETKDKELRWINQNNKTIEHDFKHHV